MIAQLTLTAFLKSSDDLPLNDFSVLAQYYNSVKNTWEPLIKKTAVVRGAYLATLSAKDTTVAAKTALAMLGKCLESGTLPMLRLINAAPLSASFTELISYGGNVVYDQASNSISINFNEFWILSPEAVKEQISLQEGKTGSVNIAIECPAKTNRLYQPLLASLKPLDKQAVPAVSKTLAPNKIYSGFVNEITRASQELANSRYSISTMSLDLKVLPSTENNEMKLQLVDHATASSLSGETVSNLRIDIVAKDTAAANTAVNPMPSVMGCTESEARKRLLKYGLKLKAIYQFTDKYTVGQAFKQNPAKDTEIVEGSDVVVIFAKSKNEFH